MDDSSTIYGTIKNKDQKESDSSIASDSDIPKPIRVRCGLLFRNENNQVLLDYNFNILPWISIIFWIIFLVSK